MKIVFMTRLFSPHIGGVEKHVDRISQLLTRQGHVVDIVTEQFESSLPKFEKNDVSVHRIPISQDGYWKKFIIWFWLLRHISLLKNADIVHAHDVYFWYLPFRLLFPCKKSFVTFHGYEGKFPVSRKAKLVRKISERLAGGNICVGKFIEKWYGTRADFITYGGVDKYQISKIKDQKSAKKLKILFVGRMEKDTGVEFYAQILRKLMDLGVEFECRAFGKGSLVRVFEPFCEVGFTKNAFSEIEKADIVFASSYLSILDALLLGKLVISVYDNPLKKDYLEMSPMSEYILVGNDPERLAERIKDGFDGKETSDKLKKGQKWAEEQTWEKVLEIYKKLWGII